MEFAEQGQGQIAHLQSERPADEGLDGAYLHDGLLNLRDGEAYLPLLLREKIQLRGDHNVQNVLAAFAIGHAAGFPAGCDARSGGGISRRAASSGTGPRVARRALVQRLDRHRPRAEHGGDPCLR
ncbi:MAG: hypothetical protein M0C28_44420 [Candidatus Moduliflexus flocculans]|nr:hypothetical protein [Candidatus Moduliflexus flocculans]